MKFEKVHSIVRDIPFINERKAKYLYDMIVRERIRHVLELGIAHGKATCYIAAALEEGQQEGLDGEVTAVDLIEAKDEFEPSAEELVEQTGLDRWVNIVRMQTGYNWFLHDMIARQTKKDRCEECFDLCIIDGPKNWTIDGAAFFFVDKLLVEGGKIIFDDYNWTYAEASKSREVTDGISHRSLSKDELSTPHIREIVDLLVLQHPNYGKIAMLDNADWVVAEKTVSSSKVVEITRTFTMEEVFSRMFMMLRRGSRIAFH